MIHMNYAAGKPEISDCLTFVPLRPDLDLLPVLMHQVYMLHSMQIDNDDHFCAFQLMSLDMSRSMGDANSSGLLAFLLERCEHASHLEQAVCQQE